MTTAATSVVSPSATAGRSPRVAVVHDYLSAWGGAERVVLSIMAAFPDAPLHTSVYEPARTFHELHGYDVHTSLLDHIAPLRNHYRLSLPLLPWAFGHLDVGPDADVVLCSSSGWAHGLRTELPKVVYCHNPARWLYQGREYGRNRKRYRLAAAAARPFLLGWDQHAAASCRRYLANSRVVADRIEAAYGIDAEVLPPPVSFDVSGPHQAVAGLEPGFMLSVGRLQPYKNVDAVVAAFSMLGGSHRLVVAGEGPMRDKIEPLAGSNVTFVGRVSDHELRWLYANAAGLVSAAHEDFGLTPVEANMFGTPCAVLHSNGFLDTTVDGVTGLFFDEPTPSSIAGGVRRLQRERWSRPAIIDAAQRFAPATFNARLQAIVAEVHGRAAEVTVLPHEGPQDHVA